MKWEWTRREVTNGEDKAHFYELNEGRFPTWYMTEWSQDRLLTILDPLYTPTPQTACPKTIFSRLMPLLATCEGSHRCCVNTDTRWLLSVQAVLEGCVKNPPANGVKSGIKCVRALPSVNSFKTKNQLCAGCGVGCLPLCVCLGVRGKHTHTGVRPKCVCVCACYVHVCVKWEGGGGTAMWYSHDPTRTEAPHINYSGIQQLFTCLFQTLTISCVVWTLVITLSSHIWTLNPPTPEDQSVFISSTVSQTNRREGKQDAASKAGWHLLSEKESSLFIQCKSRISAEHRCTQKHWADCTHVYVVPEQARSLFVEF